MTLDRVEAIAMPMPSGARATAAGAAVALALLALTPLASAEVIDPCADEARPPGRAHVHVIDGGDPFFDPFETVICRGDTVAWDNHSDRIHTVTHRTCQRADSRYDDCEFDSVFTLTPGTTFEHTFAARSGVFDYKCTIHGFTGRMVVLDDAGTLPNLVVAAVGAYDTASPASKRLEATIENQGSATSSATKILFQYQNVDGAWIVIGEPKLPSINANGSIQINQSWFVANKIGDFPVRVIADPGANQLELDEQDNELLVTIALWVPPGFVPGVSLPEPF